MSTGLINTSITSRDNASTCGTCFCHDVAADLRLGASLLTKLLFHHLFEASLLHRYTEHLDKQKIHIEHLYGPYII